MCVLVLAYEIMEDSSNVNFAQLQLWSLNELLYFRVVWNKVDVEEGTEISP
jgi:hypothetical protein